MAGRARGSAATANGDAARASPGELTSGRCRVGRPSGLIVRRPRALAGDRPPMLGSVVGDRLVAGERRARRTTCAGVARRGGAPSSPAAKPAERCRWAWRFIEGRARRAMLPAHALVSMHSSAPAAISRTPRRAAAFVHEGERRRVQASDARSGTMSGRVCSGARDARSRRDAGVRQERIGCRVSLDGQWWQPTRRGAVPFYACDRAARRCLLMTQAQTVSTSVGSGALLSGL
jgi:hypothetical protein